MAVASFEFGLTINRSPFQAVQHGRVHFISRRAVQSKSKTNDCWPARRKKDKTLIISYRVLFPLGGKTETPLSLFVFLDLGADAARCLIFIHHHCYVASEFFFFI